MQYQNDAHTNNNENNSKEIKMESSKEIVIDENQETLNFQMNLKFIENIYVTEHEKKFYANKLRTVYQIKYLLNGENHSIFRNFKEFDFLFKQVNFVYILLYKLGNFDII